MIRKNRKGVHRKKKRAFLALTFCLILPAGPAMPALGAEISTTESASTEVLSAESESASTEVSSTESGEDCMEVFDYLSENTEINDLLEEIIEKRDEEFLAALEKEALIAKIKQENEYAMASVADALDELAQEEGEKLLEEEDEANGDVAVQTFQDRLAQKKQQEQEQADKKQVVSIQDVFASNTDKTAADYEHSVVFKITAYCPCSLCNGPWSGGVTSTGVTASQGRTIAVDPTIIPYGTKVLIGGHEFVAEDCGGAIKGNHIDLYLDSHERCNSWGVRYLTVSWNGGSRSAIASLSN